MTIVDDHVKSQNHDEGNKITTVDPMKGTKQLSTTLQTIYRDLEEIGGQNKLKLFFTDLNMGKLEDCVKRLSSAMETFMFANILRRRTILCSRQSRRKMEAR